jgi:hypothetical protein
MGSKVGRDIITGLKVESILKVVSYSPFSWGSILAHGIYIILYFRSWSLISLQFFDS